MKVDFEEYIIQSGYNKITLPENIIMAANQKPIAFYPQPENTFLMLDEEGIDRILRLKAGENGEINLRLQRRMYSCMRNCDDDVEENLFEGVNAENESWYIIEPDEIALARITFITADWEVYSDIARTVKSYEDGENLFCILKSFSDFHAAAFEEGTKMSAFGIGVIGKENYEKMWRSYAEILDELYGKMLDAVVKLNAMALGNGLPLFYNGKISNEESDKEILCDVMMKFAEKVVKYRI